MRIVPLREARDEESFGGKASALARAVESGLPVPEGFALSWEMTAAIAAGDEQCAAEAARWFENLKGPVSVRSSALGEDSADASFAGQHATVLNVITSAEFLEAVRTVHSSAVADSARAYRIRVGIDAPARIAVAVQRMIRSDCAGVLFTRNPLTGANERLIESSWGLGEAVVAGLVSPDRYRLSASGAVLERTAGMKDVAVVMRPEGHTAQEDVAADKVNVLTLSDADLEDLHALARRVETAFGPDQDVEWAFEDGRLYLLQARPITRIERSAAATGFGAARSTTRPDSPSTPDPRPSTLDSGPPSAHAPLSTLSRRRFAGLGLAALLAPLNSTIIAVALPSIGADLEADPASITRWLVTSYLIVSIIAQSPAGKLGDVFGYSRVLTAGRILFGAGALLSVFANHLLVLAAGRIAMAVGGSLTIPTVMAELRNSTPPERRGRVFGTFGAIMGTAAGAGPLLGGLLTARFGWHSIFLLNLPVIILSLILEPPHRDRTAERRGGIDLLGSLLFGAGILALLIGTQKTVSLGAILIGLLLIFVFVLRELRADEPMLDVRLFTLRSFAAGSSIVALQNLAMYATLFLLPFLLS
ncbi:MAG TPA: MFS transporter, partial [Thermoanaerobaculia bacterium]|nr:MFS transporter [Thermoanaerobaculia bacterium]